ncbi:hypothetical protein TNCV_514701 [Trichonephila clavipes]|nr:hypothetical protein TNCV_514701 [Trichonephila clavipes]
MLQDYDTSFNPVHFSRPRLFSSLSLSLPFRPFSPPSLPDPFLYIVSRSTCCQVQAAVPYSNILKQRRSLYYNDDSMETGEILAIEPSWHNFWRSFCDHFQRVRDPMDSSGN